MPNEEVRQKECVKRKIPKIVFLICVPSFLTEFEGFYKRFRLEVYIDEGEGREWEILYPHLGVKRNEK